MERSKRAWREFLKIVMSKCCVVKEEIEGSQKTTKWKDSNVLWGTWRDGVCLFMCALVPSKVKAELRSVRVLKECRKYKYWSGTNSSPFLCADQISRVKYSEFNDTDAPCWEWPSWSTLFYATSKNFQVSAVSHSLPEIDKSLQLGFQHWQMTNQTGALKIIRAD